MKYNTIENKLHKKSGLILLNLKSIKIYITNKKNIFDYFIQNFNKKMLLLKLTPINSQI